MVRGHTADALDARWALTAAPDTAPHQALAFYDAVLGPLGQQKVMDVGRGWVRDFYIVSYRMAG